MQTIPTDFYRITRCLTPEGSFQRLRDSHFIQVLLSLVSNSVSFGKRQIILHTRTLIFSSSLCL